MLWTPAGLHPLGDRRAVQKRCISLGPFPYWLLKSRNAINLDLKYSSDVNSDLYATTQAI